MNVRPLHDRVLVKRLDAEEKTAGGIFIPETAKEKPIQGQVMAVGPGKVGEDGKRWEVGVKKGDRILFGKYSGNELKIEGNELLILREEEIYAVIED